MYVVVPGRRAGIFENWAECEAAVQKCSMAVFRRVDTLVAVRRILRPAHPPLNEHGLPGSWRHIILASTHVVPYSAQEEHTRTLAVACALPQV